MSYQLYSDQTQESPTLDLANDCLHFVTEFFEIISASSPHIYHSALVLAPKTSIIWKLYKSYAYPFVRFIHGVPMSWGTHAAATTLPYWIALIVWSPCNRFIAVAADHTGIVDVLDSVTLQQLQTFKSTHCTSIAHRALVFSPDSCILTCSGSDYSPPLDWGIYVTSWNIQTGCVVSTIRWQWPAQYSVRKASIVYSVDGRMVGAFYEFEYYQDGNHNKTTRIFICDIVSGMFIHPHLLSVGALLSNNIWTYGESLRFATIDEIAITIWEVEFTSGAAPTVVEILLTPDNLHEDGYTGAQFLPTLCRLAIAFQGKVLVLDVWNSEYLLQYMDTKIDGTKMTFSSDGHFFACKTAVTEVCLWKETLTGYSLHKIISSSAAHPNPLLSHNGESIIIVSNCHLIQLWPTKCFISPPSSILTQAPQHPRNFLLDFYSDVMLAVVTTQEENTVTILDLKSGVPRLTIDTSTEVYGLRVIKNTVVVVCDWEVITWSLPTGDCVPGARVGLEDSSQIVNLKSQEVGYVDHTSVSPDSPHMAFIGDSLRWFGIYDAFTGAYMGSFWAGHGRVMWFPPKRSDVWNFDYMGAREVWRATGPPASFAGPQWMRIVSWGPSSRQNWWAFSKDAAVGYPWALSHGYQVTIAKDWWVLSPDGKRLLMLPPCWRSVPCNRMWKEQFLALLHCGLPEPVILELNP